MNFHPLIKRFKFYGQPFFTHKVYTVVFLRAFKMFTPVSLWVIMLLSFVAVVDSKQKPINIALSGKWMSTPILSEARWEKFCPLFITSTDKKMCISKFSYVKFTYVKFTTGPVRGLEDSKTSSKHQARTKFDVCSCPVWIQRLLMSYFERCHSLMVWHQLYRITKSWTKFLQIL